MAQTTANPSGAYGLGSASRRVVAAALATAAAFAVAVLLMAGPNGISASEQGVATVSQVASFPQVDDFVTRRYLSAPIRGDDSWKDDHITRRYLPGS